MEYCDICGDGFPSKKGRSNHIRTFHSIACEETPAVNDTLESDKMFDNSFDNIFDDMLFNASTQSMDFEIADTSMEPDFLLDGTFDIDQNEEENKSFCNDIENMSGELIEMNSEQKKRKGINSRFTFRCIC